jgi:hypothetical protein
MLNINPKMLPRLDEIEDDPQARRSRAEHEGWLGEVEGIDLTLAFLRQKRDQTRRLARVAPVALGMPGALCGGSSARADPSYSGSRSRDGGSMPTPRKTRSTKSLLALV